MSTNQRDLVAERTADAGEPVHSRLDSLGNDPEDVLANTLRLVQGLNTQQDDYEATREARNKVNPADTLTGMPGIVGGLGALVAAAFGRPDIGSGLLAGVQSGAQKGADRKTEQLDQQAAALREEIKAGRTGLGMLFQARPEAFMTPEGKDAIDPLVLGRALTGLPMPISPSSMLQNQMRTTIETKTQEAMIRSIMDADTPEGRVEALTELSRRARWNLPGTVIEKIAASAGDENQFWANLFNHMDPASVTATRVKYLQTGTTIRDHPEWLLDIAPRRDASSWSMPAELFDMSMELSAWTRQDPENRGHLQPMEAARVMWASDHGRLALWEKHMGSIEEKTSITPAQLMSEYLRQVDQMRFMRWYDPEFAESVYGEPGSPQEFNALRDSIDNAITSITTHQRLLTGAGYTQRVSRVNEAVHARLSVIREGGAEGTGALPDVRVSNLRTPVARRKYYAELDKEISTTLGPNIEEGSEEMTQLVDGIAAKMATLLVKLLAAEAAADAAAE